jgi:DNA-binding MurR/RpiR family transcriptional regulator
LHRFSPAKVAQAFYYPAHRVINLPQGCHMPRHALPATDEHPLASPPITAEHLLQTITGEYDDLPRQLKRIASYISQQSEPIMVDRISDIARECEVHPSAIVRFSQRFDFSGFSEMQALFRQAWTHKATPLQNYQLAISFVPYARETQHCLRFARQQNANALIITDSPLSPLARLGDSVLLVDEGSALAFRSLSATLCLCQALFVAVAYRLALNVDEIHEQPGFDD